MILTLKKTENCVFYGMNRNHFHVKKNRSKKNILLMVSQVIEAMFDDSFYAKYEEKNSFAY